MVHKFFDKKSSGANTSDCTIESEIVSNQKLAEELHKPVVRKIVYYQKI